MKRLALLSAAILAGFCVASGYADVKPGSGAASVAAPLPQAPPPGPVGPPWLGAGPGGHHGDRDHDVRMGMLGMMGLDFGDGPAFALFAPSPDKQLSAADVKIIAQALLLEHGNHAWTVADVAIGADKTIGFSYLTPHGDKVASFTVDPETGFIKRVG